ncbi:hypothetical protein [Micromonospora sp. WMMD1082]|nr:hypothetical protein [Micromonospora sp. WMMD1082]MDG4797254.1 hypothetical protein [Micromonospora sp. WMMD1082]
MLVLPSWAGGDAAGLPGRLPTPCGARRHPGVTDTPAENARR